MRQKITPAQEDTPFLNVSHIKRPDRFDLNMALDAFDDKKVKIATAINGLFYLAAQVNDREKAKTMHDRIVHLLSSRQELVGKRGMQEVLAVLNDIIGRTRSSVRTVTKKTPVKSPAESKAAKESEQSKRDAMPGVFREVTVQGATVELFFCYSKGKLTTEDSEGPLKTKPLVRVYAIKSGKSAISKMLTQGSTYQLHGSNMPEVLKEALKGINTYQVMQEVDEKREALEKKEEPVATEVESTEQAA